MRPILLAVVLSVVVLLQLAAANQPQKHRRFEYKYSFKPPYLAQKDGTVPFWEYGGNAIASSESVRVAPSLRSQKGAIWTKAATNFEWWEVEVVFRVSGRGRIGADGLALWYTTTKGDYHGDVFGSSDSWNGLGVFFDSFDNDNKHNNPYVMAVLNDGTKKFDHANDGASQLLAGCLRDFRNKPFPTRARIEYYQNTLTVLFHNGMTNNNEDYEMCLRAENVFLPANGHFGVSAATGGLADDHDVFHFLTTSLHVPGQVTDSNKLPEADSARLAQEYQDYQRKLDEQKQQYHKEHPELEVKTDEFDDVYESDNQRELRQVWNAQSQMTEVLRDLSRKIDEVIGRQERTLGLLSTNAAAAVPGQAPVVVAAGSGELKRHEIDALLSNQQHVVATLRDLRQASVDLLARADTILQNQARAPTAQIQQTGGYGAFDVQSTVNELRDSLHQIRQGVQATNQRLGANHVNQAQAQTAPGQAVACSNCLGTTAFLVGVTVQLLLTLAYTMYRDNRDSQAKKFY